MALPSPTPSATPTLPPDSAPSPQVLDQAMDWMVRLRSGRARAADQAAFERWQSASPAHAAAWQRLQGRLGAPLQAIARMEQYAPGQQAQIGALLRQPPQRPQVPRRAVLRSLSLLAGAGAAAWTTDRFLPLAELTADLRTHTGERRQFALQDGSRLLLNARSAASVDGAQRLIVLHAGDAIATAAPDTALPARPLCLATPHAQVQALRGRFLVALGAAHTEVVALEQALQVVPAHGPAFTLARGQGTAVDAAGQRHPLAAPLAAADWEHGYLSASPLPLGQVVAALQRYTPAVLRTSPAAAQLAVQASLPLDDVARSLQALADTLPIRVRRFGPWWTQIDLATA